jgi:hypothetical protein
MKSRTIALILSLLVCSLSLPAQIFAAEKTAKPEGEAAADEKDSKKNTTVLVLAAKPEAVHTAALEALAAIGCTVKKDSPTSIEGKRANKVGLAVGSGGEKLFVTIKDLSDGKTELKVVTKKTILGIVGQKLWNEEVANHVRDAVK